MEPMENWEKVTYGRVVASNIRAERNRAGVSQQVLATRMRALGYDQWLHQTVGAAERGERRVTADEVFGIALALSTTISALMAPPEGDRLIMLTDDVFIGSASARKMAYGNADRTITWNDGQLGVRHVFAAVSGSGSVSGTISVHTVRSPVPPVTPGRDS